LPRYVEGKTMSNQLISNKIILIAGIAAIAMIFYFQDYIPDSINIQEIEIPSIPDIIPEPLVFEVEPDAKETGEILAEITSKDQEITESETDPVVIGGKTVNLGDFMETTSNEIPFFKSSAEQFEWYAGHQETGDFPNIENQCDPLIREFKQTSDFNFKVHLAKKIMGVCEF
jgi:hypothetical protein